MKMNILAIADALSDRNLLTRLPVLAGGEREMTVELVAHLAALDSRPTLYAAEGYGSLFSYCTQALRLSEDAACNRIEAARACRRLPVILGVLARACRRSRREIETLVAELAPQPDVPSSVRKLPMFSVTSPSPAAPPSASTHVSPEPPPAIIPSPGALPPATRPIVRATAPERYRVQFTIGPETHERLRRL